MLDLGRTILFSVERNPNAPALATKGQVYSYQEWYERIEKLAGALLSSGLKKQDRLVSVLQNTAEAATLHWACQLAGIVIVPLNWRMKPEEIDYCLTDSEARGVVFQDVSQAAVLDAPASASIVNISVAAGVAGASTFDDLVATGTPGTGPQASFADWSVMLYTSGTTGKPKGVPRRHMSERAAACAHVAQNTYTPGERTLGVMPLYHTMGVRSLLSMSLVNGLFVTQARFSASESIDLIDTHKISALYLVPTLYHELLVHPSFEKSRVEACGKLGFAGAPMTDGLLRKVQDGFQPDRIVNHYGSSEVYTFTVDPFADRKPGSAGKAGINQRIRVLKLGETDPSTIADIGEEGQIAADLSSDEAFDGYWNRPDADRKSIHSGWYLTGDTGFFDADGDLFVTGRVDDMIITGGENVSPVEVESTLSLHDAIDEVVVAGLPDERWGQRIVAFVTRSCPIDAEELDRYCQESDLSNFKRPREYIFVRAIPKSPTGKVLRRLLIAGEYETVE